MLVIPATRVAEAQEQKFWACLGFRMSFRTSLGNSDPVSKKEERKKGGREEERPVGWG